MWYSQRDFSQIIIWKSEVDDSGFVDAIIVIITPWTTALLDGDRDLQVETIKRFFFKPKESSVSVVKLSDKIEGNEGRFAITWKPDRKVKRWNSYGGWREYEKSHPFAEALLLEVLRSSEARVV